MRLPPLMHRAAESIRSYIRGRMRRSGNPVQETLREAYRKLSKPAILLLLVLVLFANAPTGHIGAEDPPPPASDQQPASTEAKHIDKRECGWTEVDCKFQNILIDLANQAFDVMKDMLAIFILEPGQLLENETVSTFFNLIKGVSWSLATVFLVYQCLRIYTLNLADGDRSELRKLLPKIFLIPVFMMGLPWMVEGILTLSGAFSRGFLAVPSVGPDGGQMLGFAAIYMLFMGATGSLFIVILVLVFLALLAVFAFQQCLRFAELAFLVVTGPVAIMSILNQEFNLFPSWWRHLLSVAFTQSVQYLLIVMAIKLATGTNPFQGDYMGIFGSIGCMVLVIKSPGFIREFMYSTGAGRKAAGMAASTAVTAGRSLIKLIK
ncbi:conjugal transfer protein TrbL family protein [Paenibacillus sp. HJGM_3]|uniref:conjugal transfer protein TrbL family protein n=1 Tax=Paenibacillus sp. HJGM_3 TaxID=3379816 RepID=UPI00385AEF47